MESLKKLFVLMFCFILLVGTVSSLDFDNVKKYDAVKEKIEIVNSFGLGDTLAEYTLTENSDQCLINCYAEGTAILYEKDKLFRELKFRGRNGNYKTIKKSNIFIETTTSYEIDVNDYGEVCTPDINGTNCVNEIIGSHTETVYETSWKEYNNDNLDPGEYKWRIEGRKELGESIDWVGSSFGEEFTEWAWWNANWNRKREITNLTGDISYLRIAYDSDMNANFSDIRFSDSSETNELGLFLQEKVDSSFAVFRVNNAGNSSIYMYYDNSLAPSSSDIAEVYGTSLNSTYFFDESSGSIAIDYNGVNNGTITSGVTIGQSTAIINQSYLFLGESTAPSFSIPTKNYLADFSVSLWAKRESGGDSVSERLITGIAGNTFSIAHEGAPKQIIVTGGGGSVLYTSFNITYGDWFNLVYVQDSGTEYFYADGVEINSSTNTRTITSTSFRVGSEATNNRNFAGNMDEFRFYQKALTPAEVSNLANETEPNYILGSEILAGIQVTLNSPIDNYPSSSSQIEFNCSAASSPGETLNNISLYHNGTGTWELNQSIVLIDLTENTPGVTLSSSGSVTNGLGAVIEALENTTLYRIQKHSSVTATKGYLSEIVDASTMIPLKNVTFIGDYATFNYPIIAGKEYGVFAYSDGPSYTRRYRIGAGFPIVNETIEWDRTFLQTSNTTYSGVGTSLYNIINIETIENLQNNYTTIFNSTFPEGNYLWTCEACESDDTCAFSTENRTLSVDLTAPLINISSPPAIVGYGVDGQNLTSNYDITDISEVTDCSYSYGEISNLTAIDGIYVSRISATEILLGYIYVDNNLTQNFTLSHPDNSAITGSVKIYEDIKSTGTFQTININTIPSNVSTTINLPNGWHRVGFKGGSFGGNIAELDYFSVANTNLIIPTFDLNCSANSINFTTTNDIRVLTFFALDSAGRLGINSTSWEYILFESNQTYTNQTIEGEQETFGANVVVSDGYAISEAVFYYNGTSYTTNIFSSGGNYLVSSTINIPLIDVNTNFTFFFELTIDGQQYNLTSYEQLALAINLSQCGPGDNLLLNMSLNDELTKDLIIGDLEVNAQVLVKSSLQEVGSVSTNFSDVSHAALCLSPPEVFANLYLSAEIRYSADEYVAELYHLQLADLADYPINLSLFDLGVNYSTRFLVTYQDDDLIFVEGAILQLQRKYISENLYEVVEAPLTSDIGTAVVHVDLNTNKYKATIVKDGEILDIFDNLVFNCENELSGECTEKLLGQIDSQNDVPLIITEDFSYSVTSANNTITTLFIIPSGTPSPVNVELVQVDLFGNESICNQTVISSGGSIDCTFNDTIGESYLFLKIKKDSQLQGQQSYVVTEDSGLDFLGSNYLIIIILLLSVVGMSFSSTELIVINSVMVMVIVGGLWLVNGLNFVMGLGSLIWLVIAAIILIAEMSKQEDR